MMINLFSKALVVLVILMVVMAILFGATIGNAEFLSPSRTAAEVQTQRITAEHQARMNDLAFQKQQARTEQEIRHIENEMRKEDARARAEIDAIARRAALTTEFIANLQMLALILLGLIGTAAIFTLTFLVARFALARLPAGPPDALPPPPPARAPDAWSDPLYRRQRRIEAQAREAVARYRDRQAVRKDSGGQNGRQENGQKLPRKRTGVDNDDIKNLPLAM